nr:hypothetical protein PD502_07550 [Staphylococcus aureus]
MVIEALGQGNIPPSALEGIQQLVSLNIPIVLVSRSFNGIVSPTYSIFVSYVSLLYIGAVPNSFVLI